MNRLLICILAITLLSVPSFAGKKEEAAAREAQLQLNLDNIRREVEALRKIKAEKLDKLEGLETVRWEGRYRQSQEIQDHQEKIRSLDGKYSKSSTDLGRLNDELVQAKAASDAMKEKAEDAQSDLKALGVQVQQAIDRAATDLASDYPVELDKRTLLLSQAQEVMRANRPNTLRGLDLYTQTLAKRLALTTSQEFIARNSQMGTTAEVPVYRLRLGTIFLGEAAREGLAVQALQRTGAMQGKVFEWRMDLSESFSKDLRTAVLLAQQGKAEDWIPMDVLQNKSVQATTRKDQETSWKREAKEFFKAGGPVMYPLMLVAILALLLSLERWVTFVRRGRISQKFIQKINELVDQKQFEAAHNLAKSQGTCLGNAMAAVLMNVPKCSRTAAEKALREVMLREQPLLERRMGLVGAFGSSAPLLGLLGTVTGMISLFKVITDVGTNDAKVLAGGIAEALITTETGLVIAIPVLLLHGWLTERLDIITSSLGIQSMALLNKLWPEADQHQ